MNAISLARRSILEQIEDARDYRTDEQKLAALIDEHLSNCAARDRLNGPGSILCESASRSVDLACESSQAELWHLIEDMTCCDVKKLAKALQS